VIGLGVSIYLTIAHFNSHVTLACPATSTINCEKVTTSPESYFLHIPVALLGLAFYFAMVGINLPRSWKVARFDRPRFLMASLGVLFILWLIYSEIITIGAICLWCTSVHLVTLLNFLILLYAKMTYPSSQTETRSFAQLP
jgi:uncharacterized membrane protein